MTFLIGFLLILGFVDSLNPFSIAVHIFLLGVLKNTNRIAIYVLGILVVYLFGGIIIFSGLTTVFEFFLEQFELIPAMVLGLIEAFLGLFLVGYGIAEYRKQHRSQINVDGSDVAGWKLFLLGAGGTLSDLPTALPYLGFIARMTEIRLELATGILLLFFYNFIYILPLLVLWGLFLRYRDSIRSKMEGLVRAIERANRYLMVVFCELIGGFFIVDAILFLLKLPVQ